MFAVFTSTLTYLFASAAPVLYVLPVAPEIFAYEPLTLLARCHWYVVEVVPLGCPLTFAVSVAPTDLSPDTETDGAEWLALPIGP